MNWIPTLRFEFLAAILVWGAFAGVIVGGCSKPEKSTGQGEAQLGDGWAGEGGTATQPALKIPADAPLVVFLGDSLSAGLHLDADQAFPALLQRRLVEKEKPFRLVNAGVSGDTTAGGLRRIDWLLQQKPAVVVVELGANDGLRGIEIDTIESNLRHILERILAADAVPILAGMHIPTSYGQPYSEAFHQIYGRLAEELKVPLVADFLDGVGGVPEHNLEDGMHPNPTGHGILADNLEEALSERL